MNFFKAPRLHQALILLGSYIAWPTLAWASPKSDACEGALGNTACNPPAGSGTLQGGFRSITTLLIFIIGSVSVIMVIIGGLRYVLSQGDPASIKGAKDTILYALIGVAVAVLAYALVTFVIKRF